MRLGLAGTALAWIAYAHSAAFSAEADPPVATATPIDTIRSLQRVLGNAALGDRSAFEMQRVALGLADEKIRRLTDEQLSDPKVRHAVIIYGFSGGNPATLEKLLARMERIEIVEVTAAAEHANAAGDHAAAEDSHKKEPADEGSAVAEGHEATSPNAHGKEEHGAEDGHANADTETKDTQSEAHGDDAHKETASDSHGTETGHGETAEHAEQDGDQAVIDIVRTLVLDKKTVKPEQIKSLSLPASERAALWLFNGFNETEAETGIQSFRKAAALSPGTIIEEAALRRSIGVLAEANDNETLLRFGSRYLRTFYRSPYASDFVSQFSKASAKIETSKDRETLKEIISFLPPLHASNLTERIVREAVLSGNFVLAQQVKEFASAPTQPTEEVDERTREETEIYGSIADLTGEKRDDAIRKIREISVSSGSADNPALVRIAKELADAIENPWAGITAPVSGEADSQSNPTENISASPENSEVAPSSPPQDSIAFDEMTTSIRERLDEAKKLLEQVDQ